MDERSERMAQRFEVPMVIAALLVIPVIVIEESPVGPAALPTAAGPAAFRRKQQRVIHSRRITCIG